MGGLCPAVVLLLLCSGRVDDADRASPWVRKLLFPGANFLCKGVLHAGGKFGDGMIWHGRIRKG